MNLKSIGIITTLAARNIGRNKRRSLLTLLAIALATTSSLVLAALARGISQGMVENSIRNLTGHVQIHSKHFLYDPVIENSMSEEVSKVDSLLSNHKDISAWAKRIRVPGVVASERESAGITIVGIEPSKEEQLSFIAESIKAGAYLNSTDPGEIIIGKSLAELLETGIGRRVVLMSQSRDNEIKEAGYIVKGIFDTELESTEKGFVFIEFEEAKRLLGEQNAVASEYAMLLKDDSKIPNLVASLQSKFKKLDIKPWQELQPLAAAVVQVQSAFLKFWFLVVIAAASFSLVNTLFMSIFERMRELGMLQALGLKPSGIVYLISFESITLLALGQILGLLLSLSLIFVLGGGIDLSHFAAGVEHIGSRTIIFPYVLASDWIMASVLVFVVGLLSSIFPALKAARLKPRDALLRV